MPPPAFRCPWGHLAALSTLFFYPFARCLYGAFPASCVSQRGEDIPDTEALLLE